VQRCDDDTACMCGHVTPSFLSLLRHGAEEL
jgi:hypothetical protein